MPTDASSATVRRMRVFVIAALSVSALVGAAAALAPIAFRHNGAGELPPEAPSAEPPRRPGGPPPSVLRAPPDLVDLPGIERPPTRPAAEAGLADDEAVVGVQAGGRPRAYRLKALSEGAESHVVNDVLGGVPVSVTHCPFYQCTRVFTGEGADPLALRQGGLIWGGMLLRWDGRAYRQETQEPLNPKAPAFPYPKYPNELTTWGAWRRAHPDTDVYLGPSEDGADQK
jgi:hypothetical protein